MNAINFNIEKELQCKSGDSLLLSRKYLTMDELKSFVNCTSQLEISIGLFCHFMAITGCKVSEALNMRYEDFDLSRFAVTISADHVLSKRIVPITHNFAQALSELMAHKEDKSARIWEFTRMSAYRYVCDVMDRAGITGQCASPNGLRHGFALMALQSGVPLHVLQNWLGHSTVKSTVFYLDMLSESGARPAECAWDVSLSNLNRNFGAMAA